MTEPKTCMHCGAVGADLFANDGSRVCERCFAYDQVVAGELRVSQADLGLTPTGDASDLAHATQRVGRNEWLIVGGLAAAALAFAYWGIQNNPFGFFGAGILAVMALLMALQAFRTGRFARTAALEIEKRASSAPPPAMTGAAMKRSA